MEQPRSWSHLPDVCLLLVFKKLSTSDMIRSVGRVCTNWARIQRVELQNRTSLVIVGERAEGEDDSEERLLSYLRSYSSSFGSDMIEHVRREDGTAWAVLQPLEQIKFDVVRVVDGAFAKGNITPLMDKLPNITHLTVKIWHKLEWPISIMMQVTRLINHYSTSLILLRLELGTDRNHYRFQTNGAVLSNTMRALFDSINRLESLRHLTQSVIMPDYIEPRLSILTRLATFTCKVFSPVQSLLAVLRQYTTGDDLRIQCDAQIGLKELIRLDPHLATKFTRVHVAHLSPDDYQNMRLFCDRFVSLHSLWIDNWGMPMTMLARCLSQLPYLIHLKLDFNLIALDESTPPLEIAQVPSVRLITLRFMTISHLDTERLHLAQIFPNLQVLHSNQRNRYCSKCDYPTDALSKPELHPQIEHCYRLARQPFRACTNLHTIKFDTDEEELRTFLPQGFITREDL